MCRIFKEKLSECGHECEKDLTYRTMSAPLDDIQCDFLLAAANCKAKPESGGSMNGTTWYLAAGRHAPMAATI